MANNHSTLTELFVNVANAIRAKNSSTGSIIADNFPSEINKLQTGLDYSNQNVNSISDYEFYNCSDLRYVDCYNLTSIGASAFENCDKLQSAILWNSVSTIGENAFKGCSNVTIYCEAESKPEGWYDNWNPYNRPVVWGYAPAETLDISYTEKDNVVAKLYSSVKNDGMYTLVISGNGRMKPYDRETIPWNMYRDSIKNVIIHEGVVNIINNAFSYCTNLTSITIPDSVTSIGNWAFVDCTNLTSITIPDGVTSIGEGVFNYCTNLTSITIPDSVTSIGDYVFNRCTNLTSITYIGTRDQWNAITFGTGWNSNTGSYTIHCNDGDIAKS